MQFILKLSKTGFKTNNGKKWRIILEESYGIRQHQCDKIVGLSHVYGVEFLAVFSVSCTGFIPIYWPVSLFHGGPICGQVTNPSILLVSPPASG